MDKSIKKLTAAGYKLTKPRLAVWQCLSQSERPLSAREIHQKIGDCDQASVYRALSLFESVGLVKAETVGKEKFYCSADQPHHHIICRCCGLMEDFPCTHKFNEINNFTDIEHQLTLYGVCGKCQK